jgi:ribosomal protein S18 acetylase RimI-like enzyme
MADPTERGFDGRRDLPELLTLIGSAKASSDAHAFLHPGGLQWLLRKVGHGPFAVRQWFDRDVLTGVVVEDSGYVIIQAATSALDRHLWLLGQAEAHLRQSGQATIEVSVWESDRELLSSLQSLGYEPSGTYGHELVYEAVDVPRDPTLPEGFSMRWLEPNLDDAYIELHRAAWSTWAPSTYDRRMHAAVTTMPDFARELVPIIAAPDGALAAYCIGWFDPRTRTVEIEPLGTHPEFRRLGLARAIVQEVVKLSAQRAAKSVMVWGVSTNPEAVHLYESAGFHSRSILRDYRRKL